MSGLLTRTYQVGAKVNSVEGTAEALAAADFSIECKNATFTRELTRYERLVGRPGLSQPKNIVGGKYGKLDVDVELNGGGAALAARVPWWDMLQGCGMSLTIMKKIVCVESAVAARFVPGATIGNNASQGSATATGLLVWAGVLSSHAVLVYVPLTGTFADTDTISAYHAGATGTLTQNGALTDAGPAFRFKSETASQTPSDLTVEFRDGEDVNRLVGARGTVQIMLNHGEPALAKFSFEGPRVLQTYPGTPIRAGFVASVPTPAAPTAVHGDVGMPFTVDTHAPILDQITLDVANTLTQRKTVSTGGVLAYLDGSLHGGYAPTRITDRKPVLSINPDRPGQATYDWFLKWQANTAIELYIQNGRLDTAGQNALVVVGPSVTIDETNISDADKNGIRGISGKLKFNGDADDEIVIANVYI